MSDRSQQEIQAFKFSDTINDAFLLLVLTALGDDASNQEIQTSMDMFEAVASAQNQQFQDSLNAMTDLAEVIRTLQRVCRDETTAGLLQAALIIHEDMVQANGSATPADSKKSATYSSAKSSFKSICSPSPTVTNSSNQLVTPERKASFKRPIPVRNLFESPVGSSDDRNTAVSLLQEFPPINPQPTNEPSVLGGLNTPTQTSSTEATGFTTPTTPLNRTDDNHDVSIATPSSLGGYDSDMTAQAIAASLQQGTPASPDGQVALAMEISHREAKEGVAENPSRNSNPVNTHSSSSSFLSTSNPSNPSSMNSANTVSNSGNEVVKDGGSPLKEFKPLR